MFLRQMNEQNFNKNRHFYNNWIYSNKKTLLEDNDETCKEILRRHDEYIKKNEIQRKFLNYMVYVSRIKEIVNIIEKKGFFTGKDCFSSGILISPWFLKFKNSILNGKTEDCKIIQEAYSRYKQKLVEEGKISYEDDNQKKEFNKAFKQRQLEYFLDKDENKFSSNYKGTFKDGVSKLKWLNNYAKKTIFSGVYGRKLRKQYLIYKKEQKKALLAKELKQFEEREEFFVNHKNLSKFNYKYNYKFPDSDCRLASFFSSNRKRLFKGKYRDLLIKQYKDYRELVKKKIHFLDDFIKEKNKNKYLKVAGPTFSCHLSYSSWFYNNLNVFLESKDERIKGIVQEFKDVMLEETKIFLTLKDTHKFDSNYVFEINGNKVRNWYGLYKEIFPLIFDSELINLLNKQYIDYLNEEEKVKKINKVKFIRSLVMFYKLDEEKFNKDNKNYENISKWFYENFDLISNLDDKFSKGIMLQYYNYLNKKECEKKIKEVPLSRLKAFNELKILKFDLSQEICFKDGLKAAVWFEENMSIISRMTTKQARKTMDDYQYFLKLKEFAEKEGLDKFEYEKMVKFEDNRYTAIWFEKNMDTILSSDDYLSLKIIEEYESFKNKPNKVLLKSRCKA